MKSPTKNAATDTALDKDVFYKRVLGIDLGLASLGYSVFDYKNNEVKLISYGTLSSNKTLNQHRRIFILFKKINCIIDTFKIEIMNIEIVFHYQNTKTINVINQVYGGLIVLAENKSIPIHQLTPSQVKKYILHYRVTKKEIVNFVKNRFNICGRITDDTADAIFIGAYAYKDLESFKL